jgi:hypothetical protein
MKLMKRRWWVTRLSHNFIASSIIAILIASVFAIPIKAQTGSMRLEGIVWDPSGNPLPDAQMSAVEATTGLQYETRSDRDGYYRYLVLPPGIYTVTAKAKGFKDVIHRSIFLYSAGSLSDNFTFEGSAIEKEIGPNERINLLDSPMAGSFSRRELEALPLLNRDPLSLLINQSSVQINGGSEDLSTVNGARRGMISILRDGLSITDPVSPAITASMMPTNPDSIEDLQIISSGGNAEYGRSGSAQVIMLSRPGANTWSKSVYDYFQNKRFNSNNFFNNAANLPRPQFTRNMFGADVSGPLGDKSRLYVNFEGNLIDQKIVRNRTVLTSTAKTGLFQWYTPDDTTRDSTTIKTFNIAANDSRKLGINPAVASLLVKTPDPNNYTIGDGLNTAGYRFYNPADTNQERADARFDRVLNAHHQLFLRFYLNHTDATDLANNADATFPGEPSGRMASNNWGFAVGSDYTLSPMKINELRIGYLRITADQKRPSRSTAPMLMANSWTNPLDPSFPGSTNSSAFEVSDNLSHAKGLHTLKYGFTFQRTQHGGVDNSGVFPNITFGTDNGNKPSDAIGPSEQSVISTTDRQTFEKLYNDLLGRVESVHQTYYSSLASTLPAGTGRDRSFASQQYAGFIQDTWRYKPRFTLNFGLRYELASTPKELNGFQGVLDKASQISSSANISNFKIVPGNNWHSTILKDFAPRAGFAWDMFGGGSMVLRGAYGIYFDHPVGGVTDFIDQNSYGFSQPITLYPNASGTDLRLSDKISLPAQPGPLASQPLNTRSTSIAVWDPNLSTPNIHQFHLMLQTKFAGAILEASYVGTRGKDLFQYLNLNQSKIYGGFLQAYNELKAYRDAGTPVPSSNALIRIFGSPMSAMNALGGSNLDSGQVGVAADNLDRNYFGKYANAGVSDFYLRNFPQFNQFLFGTNAGKSWYDALQAGIRKSSNNYHFKAFYSWGKSLDTISSDGANLIGSLNSFNPASDKAPSDFSRTHIFNFTWDYAIPIGRNPQGDSDTPKWVQTAFGGWNLGMLYVKESGERFSINSGLQTQFAGVPSSANFSGNRDVGSIFRQFGYIYWFYGDQTSLFSYPDAGKTGTSGRNSFQGPGYTNLDVSLNKKFPTGENKFLQLKIEAYNVLNKVNFGLPHRDLVDPLFGTIATTRGSARRLQLAMRFQF